MPLVIIIKYYLHEVLYYKISTIHFDHDLDHAKDTLLFLRLYSIYTYKKEKCH